MRSHLIFTTYLSSSFVGVTICVGSICWNHEGQKVHEAHRLRRNALPEGDGQTYIQIIYIYFALL